LLFQPSSIVTTLPIGPGNFLEVRKILPLLIAESPEQPSFHVVALSLPGFGFSEAPKKRGFTLDQFAEVGHKLMLALGYDEYGEFMI
jgi:pimeloyl-ACP methyl ester carboxylesterase